MADIEINSTAFNLDSILSVIARRTWLIGGVYAFLLAVTAAYCFFWPPSYEAIVRFLVKNDRQDPILSTDQGALQTQTRAIITEEELNTEAEVLRSSEVVGQAALAAHVDKMPEHWAIKLLNAPLKLATVIYNDYHHKPSQTAESMAVDRVLRKLEVAAEKKTNIISARLTWGDPRLSREILERIRDAYLDKHLLLHQAPSQEFFRQQLAAKRIELEGLDNAIAAVRLGKSLPVVGEEEKYKVRQSSELESEWRRVQASAKQSVARVAELERQLESSPERIVSQEQPVRNSIALGNLKAQVLELQRKQAELRTRFSDENRFVKQNQEELAAARAMLRSETDTPVVDHTVSINKVHESLREQLALAQAERKSLATLEAALFHEWQASDGGVTELSKQGAAMRRLERDREVLVTAMQLYSRRLEEARATDAMDRMRMTNVVPIEAVVVNPMPVKPKIGLAAKLALSLGLLIAFSIAFGVELVTRRLQAKCEIEELLRIPVLAEMPRWEPSSRNNN
jgi:uncharacterized protein involved in exopolysaccharide biosynthesis